MMNMKQEKILVVDDEETIRKLLKRILEGAGYSVVTATNGLEAMYQLSLGEAKVMLLDISMPKMSGIEVLSHLSVRGPDYCVIMVTANTDLSMAVDALKLGAYDYITKPFDQNDVKAKVQEAINKWHNMTEEKFRYSKVSEAFAEQTRQMQEQFGELVKSLSREHQLLYQVAVGQPDGGKSMLSKLPPELQEPIASVEEFRDALIRILKRS